MRHRSLIQVHHRERGQAIIIVVLAMTVLLGFTAMTIDVGLIFEERRHAQNAADAAALAGVSSLPPFGTPGEAQSKANTWAAKNGYQSGKGTSVKVQYPYNNDVSRLEVQIERPVPFVFGKALGLDKTTVTARAVARATFTVGASGSYSIFVNNSSCSTQEPLDIQGSNMTFIGGVHSNSKFNVGSSGNTFTGPTGYVCAKGFSNQNANNVFNPPTQQTTVRQPPVSLSYGQFPCTVTFTQDTLINSVPTLWLNDNPATKQLKDNVICSTKNLTLSNDSNRGSVTLAAQGNVVITGSNNVLTPKWNYVLAYSSGTGNPAIEIAASGGSYSGYLHAPNGRVTVQGSGNLVIAGGVIADTVTVNGSSFEWDASKLPPIWPGPGAARLVE